MRHVVQILRGAIFAELDRLFDLPAIVGYTAQVFAVLAVASPLLDKEKGFRVPVGFLALLAEFIP